MPRVTLTDNLLKSTKTGEFWDTAVPGLVVRMGARKKTFFAARRRPGAAQPTWHKVGEFPDKSIADARRSARAAIGALAAGDDPGETPGIETEAQTTFGAVAEQFMTWHRDTPGKDGRPRRTAGDTAAYIRRELLPVWGERPISAITRRNVVAVVQAVMDRGGARAAPGSHRRSGGPYAARSSLAAARLVFGWAHRRELIAADPVAIIDAAELHGAAEARDRVLTDDELRAVWAVAGQTPYPFGPLVRLLLLTGARLREVAEASWSEVAPSGDLLTIPTTRAKTKVAHTIPLSATAAAILRDLPRFEGGDYLFSTRVGGRGQRDSGHRPISGFSKFKQKLDARAGIAPYTLHDLRRTVRTGLSTLRVPPHVAEMVIGHQQQGIAKIYDLNRFDDEKREALQAWERRLLAIVAPPPTEGNVVPMRA